MVDDEQVLFLAAAIAREKYLLAIRKVLRVEHMLPFGDEFRRVRDLVRLDAGRQIGAVADAFVVNEA